MAFLLFLLVNLVLFIRPSELMPELAQVPIYYILIVAALLAASPAILKNFSVSSLRAQPVTICVLCLLPAILLSYPLGLIIWAAQYDGTEFAKVLLYYLLLLAVVRSETRLKCFLMFLAILVASSAVLALLHERGVIYLPALESVEQAEIAEDGSVVSYPRLRSTGIFNDPNDFAMILVAGIVSAIFMLGDRSWGIARGIWLGPLIICCLALWETKSRGGILAIMAAMIVLTHARRGWKTAGFAAVLVLPAVMAGFSMRGDGGVESGTGQQRVQLWSEGLLMFRSYPIFGIGQNRYPEEFGHVAHNSFVNSYVELGLIGGTLFFGANAVALWTLYRVRKDPALTESIESRRLLAAVTAILAGSIVSQLTLSRAYVVTPYLAIGLAVAFTSVVPLYRTFDLPRFSGRFLLRLSAASLAFLFVIQVYVRFAARWS